MEPSTKSKYLVVEPKETILDAKLLMPPEWLKTENRLEARLYVTFPQETVPRSLRFDPLAPVARPYEERLSDHYGRLR